MTHQTAEEILAEADARGLRRVLIVTAIALEMRAVRAHLEDLGDKTLKNDKIVELGLFSANGEDCLIVVAESGAGNADAQAMVTSAVSGCGPFDMILFVGVAGSRKSDVPIGSVVASKKIYNPHAGKWEKGDFFPRPNTLPAHRALFNLATKTERDGRWQERIRPARRETFPDPKDYPQPYPPRAFVAPIASIEAVSADKDGQLELIIKKHYGDAHAVEMEGLGILTAAEAENTPAIIIRGISDMAGEDKDPIRDAKYQPISAAHAAAFAFELIALRIERYPMPIQRAEAKVPSIAPPPEQLPPPVAPREDRTNVAFSFAGSRSNFPPERCEEIAESLRDYLGDPSVSLERTDEGSFHMIFSIRQSDVGRVREPALADALRSHTGIAPSTVLTETAFLEARASGQELATASRELLDWKRTLPDGTEIARPELDEVLAKVRKEGEGTTTALLGDPGSGKSALLSTLAHKLEDERIPFVAIKADLIDPSVGDEEALREALGLQESLTGLLSKAARIRPVVLIIDQLDALATYIDLKTGRLNVLLNAVRRLGGDHNIHIVVSSRTFEYEHDTRLKTVRADSLVLDLPAWSTVLEILERSGVQAGGWPADAQRLMRSPQTLKTFLSLIGSGGSDDFTNYQKLLDRLWKERILAAENGGDLSLFVSRIAEDMAEHENLWVPSARYSADTKNVLALIAAGVLTDFGSDGKLGFTHQTLFEHALARSFAQEEGRLSSYVLGRQASLFVRPKMWAGLSYLRDVDPPTYASELREIWSRTDLRRHLRFLLVEFLGSQTDPNEDEYRVMESALSSTARRVALQAMQGSTGWFKRFMHSAIRDAMTEPEEEGIAIVTLIRAQQFDTAGVLKLLNSVWLNNSAHDGSVWAVLQETPQWTDEHLAAAQTILRRTDIADYAFEFAVSSIGAEQPEVALKLTLARLEKQLADAAEVSAKRAAAQKEEGDEPASSFMFETPSEPFNKLLEQSDGYGMLDAIARRIPKPFLDILWPWLDRALSALRAVKGEADTLGYAIPYGADARFEEEDANRLGDHALLAAFAAALDTLASQQPDDFRDWVAQHQKDDLRPVHRLLAHTMAVHAATYADLAFDYLVSDPRRLHLGSISDGSGTTKRLLSAVSVHWSDSQVAEFARYLEQYNPEPTGERDAKGRQGFNRAIARIRQELLQCLPYQRLPEQAAQKVEEGLRRFGPVRPSTSFEGPHWIGSPMSAAEMVKAKDEDIVNAFRKLPDATGRDNPKHWMKGGNIQLSREFANFAKENSQRAFALIGKFDPEFGTRAAGYALEAMAETAEATDIEEAVFALEARKFGGEEYRGSVSHGLRRLAERDLPISDAMVELLKGWLGAGSENTVETDDDGDETLLDRGTVEEKKARREESVLWGLGGISILPHGNYPILEVITRAYLQRRDLDSLVKLFRMRLQAGEDEKIWAGMLRFMRYIRPTDPTDFREFLSDLFDRFPELLTSREAAIMLAHLQWQVPEFVERVLYRWKDHPAPLVKQARGELAALISIVRPELEWAGTIVDDILDYGPAEALTGVAYAATNLWPDEALRPRALTVLKRAMPSADGHAWSAITDLFRLVDDITPTPEWIKLLELIASALPYHPAVLSTFIVDRLQTLLPDAATLVARIAAGLVTTWKSDLGDIRTATASSAAELVDIAITLHRLGPDTRELGTSLFEDLLEVNAYTARDTLDQIDNRFRRVAPQPRPRLPRRQRRAARRARS